MADKEAIESLINSCNEYDRIVTYLQEENAFLTDTIEKHNLGQIAAERRSLLLENDTVTREANQIKAEYESKIAEINTTLADVKAKQEKANEEKDKLHSKNRTLLITTIISLLIAVISVVLHF